MHKTKLSNEGTLYKFTSSNYELINNICNNHNTIHHLSNMSKNNILILKRNISFKKHITENTLLLFFLSIKYKKGNISLKKMITYESNSNLLNISLT